MSNNSFKSQMFCFASMLSHLYFAIYSNFVMLQQASASLYKFWNRKCVRECVSYQRWQDGQEDGESCRVGGKLCDRRHQQAGQQGDGPGRKTTHGLQLSADPHWQAWHLHTHKHTQNTWASSNSHSVTLKLNSAINWEISCICNYTVISTQILHFINHNLCFNVYLMGEQADNGRVGESMTTGSF